MIEQPGYWDIDRGYPRIWIVIESSSTPWTSPRHSARPLCKRLLFLFLRRLRRRILAWLLLPLLHPLLLLCVALLHLLGLLLVALFDLLHSCFIGILPS